LLHWEAQDAARRQAASQSLLERHLLRHSEDDLVPFCRLLASFVRRQRIARRAENRGVRVDVEAGDVWIDGRLLPTLTDLEYRLLLLLYGHLDKIVDKYTVVQVVWGQEYIDEVDDGRIEKLVSRLRQKLEADPARPRYLHTIRGRGYKLVSP
ncbi:MAG TPA: winged helix-turn-helix domain-containing protein, partial [Anaerolineae bacterium]|nr:winged helix-turn-helix domain-containing protein [Anaerolineae bacterium]